MDEYRKHSIKLSSQKLQMFGTLATIILMAAGITVQIVIWQHIDYTLTIASVMLLLLLLLAGFVLHELLHAAGLLLFAKASPAEFRFGFMLRYMSFYTHYRKPVVLKGVRIALLLPILLTGAVPLIVGIAANVLLLTVLGGILTAAGIGDVMMFIKLRPFPDDALIFDYPDAPGCDIYIRQEQTVYK